MKEVARWLAEGRPVTLARVVEVIGLSSRDRTATVAWTPGQPIAGTLFNGAAVDELALLLAERADQRTGFLDFRISEESAAVAGLSCGGLARLYVQPADTIPSEFWSALAAERPVALVTEVATGATSIGDARGTEPKDGQLFTAYWPTPRVIIIGTGGIADAIRANAALLGWPCADELPAQLTAADNVVVLDHDLNISGGALTIALASDAGYVGALGSRHTQARRAEWLANHGITDIAAIHGPAGLDIGSRTPAEIALSILAEIVSVRR